jgi:translocation protein SEC72
MSLPVTVDPSSKRVSVDTPYLESLTDEQQEDLTTHIEQLNDLHRHLVGINSDIPPPPTQLTAQISQQAAKLRDTGIGALKKGKVDEAIKTLNLALELAQRRPPWEATQQFIEDIAAIVGPRADAYMGAGQWPEAFGDSTLLVLIKPMDAASHFRKGRCYMASKQYKDAQQYLSTAAKMAPQNTVFKTFLQEVEAKLAEQK